MPYFSQQDVLKIFGELPGHRGCTDEDVDAVERQFAIKLPLQYRTMLRLDAARLVSAGIVAPLNRLQDQRDDADALLIEDGLSFRLAPMDVVFAWNEIHSFHFFIANGEPDPPVMDFNYYSPEDNGEPKVAWS